MEPIAAADREQHYRLRELLKDHRPITYGDLRRGHGVSPIFLETQIANYPEIFEAGTELATGKPTIRLKEGELESREDIVMRRVLVRKVRQAGQTGIFLKSLYISTRIASEEVKRLLRDVAEITATRKGRSAVILYKYLGKPEESRIQDSRKPADPLPEPVSGQAATVGMPPSNGGSDELVNLQILCERCNLEKSSRTLPVTSSVPPYLERALKRRRPSRRL